MLYYYLFFSVVFIPLTIIFYQIIPKRFRWVMLLLASIGFYFTFSYYLFVFLIFFIFFTYCTGRILERVSNNKKNALKFLRDGDCLDAGGREIRVVHTPGHSPGHCCFYEPDRQYMYTGDLVYEGCLDAFYPTTDPILMYKSVKRISQYEVSRILPGHHRLDIPVSLVSRVEDGFTQIEQQGLLRQGNGLFEFDGFQIRI